MRLLAAIGLAGVTILASTGFAANVTIVPSAPVVAPGSTFYVTVHGDDFPNTAAGDLNLTFNSAVVSVRTPTLTNGIVWAPGSPFTHCCIADNPFLSGNANGIQVLTGFAITPVGSFDAARIYFQVNPLAPLGSPTNIVVSDRDGWTHADTFELIPVTYTQANVMVGVPLPMAVDDGPIAVLEGLASIIPVGANDINFTNPATVTVTTMPAKGTITAISAPGTPAGMTVTYTANIGAVGTDSFVYEMTDTTPGSDSATVTLNISPDSDLDGVADATDNCKLVANNAAGVVPGTSVLKSQLDSDNDGFGNRCDGDLNNTGPASNVNTTDYSIMRSLMNSSVAGFPLAAVADLDGNGVVNTVDWSIFRTLINKVPGPSGYACAGTIPCP